MIKSTLFYIVSWFVLLGFFSACTKEKTTIKENPTNLPLGTVPSLQLVSVNKTNVQEYTDTLIFTIQYVDGNGDIGFNDADSASVLVIDNRDTSSLVFPYAISPRAPQGTTVAIQGELKLHLKHILRISNTNPSETTTYSIKIRDRANNWSNVVTTGLITIAP